MLNTTEYSWKILMLVTLSVSCLNYFHCLTCLFWQHSYALHKCRLWQLGVWCMVYGVGVFCSWEAIFHNFTNYLLHNLSDAVMVHIVKYSFQGYFVVFKPAHVTNYTSRIIGTFVLRNSHFDSMTMVLNKVEWNVVSAGLIAAGSQLMIRMMALLPSSWS